MHNLPEGQRTCPNCGARIPYTGKDPRDCPPGTVLNGRYLLGKAIGRGGFGVTYIALDIRTQERVCIKEYNPKQISQRDPNNPVMLLPTGGGEAQEDYQKYKKSLLAEKDRLMRLRDIPGVVKCFDGFECNNTAYVVLEFLEGCDLKHYVLDNRSARGQLSIMDSVDMTCNILMTLSQVHKHKMLHRDISPDNVFLQNNGVLKLIDFGSARNINVGEMTGFMKPGYAAPEMILGDKQGDYTDIYSVGAVLYFLLVGEKPRTGSDSSRLLPPPNNRTTPELTAIFNKATERQPSDRYQTADEMLADLQQVMALYGIQPIKQAKTRSPLGRNLLIGTLSITAVGLIGLIVMAGMDSGSQGQQPAQPTATVSTYVTSTPVPVSITEEPVSVAAITDTPVPAVRRLVGAPEGDLRLFAGQTLTINSSFGDGERFDARWWSRNSASAAAQGHGDGHAVITAKAEGKAEITYFDGSRNRSFMVEVLPYPELKQDGASAQVGFLTQSGDHSYTLTLSKGDMTALTLDQHQGVTYELILLEGGKSGSVRLLDNRTVSISAAAEGESVFGIRARGVAVEEEIIRLTVNVGQHSITGGLEAEYTMIEGGSLRIPIRFTDGATLDLSKVKNDHKALKISVDPKYPEIMIVEGTQAGVYDVTIEGQDVRFAVLRASGLQTNEWVKADGGDYAVTLPVNETLTLNLTDWSAEHQYVVERIGAGDARLAVSQDGTALELTGASVPGQGEFSVSASGVELFRLKVNTVSRGVNTSFKQEYRIFTDQMFELALDYAHGMSAAPECTVSPAGILEAAPVDSGRKLLIKGLKPGTARVTVDGKSFDVEVVSGAMGLSAAEGLTQNGNVYTLTMVEDDQTKLEIGNFSSGCKLVSDKNRTSSATLTRQNETLIVKSSAAGESTFVFRTSGMEENRELFTLKVVVEKAPVYELAQKPQTQYTVFEGATLEIPIRFGATGSFPLEMTYDASRLTITEQADKLIVTAKRAAGQTGLTPVTVQYRTSSELATKSSFTVRIAPAPAMILNGDTTASKYLEETDGGYTLYLSAGEQASLKISEVSGVEYKPVLKQGFGATDISAANGLLNVSAVRSGESVYGIHTSGMSEDGEVMQLRVVVAGHMLTSNLSASGYNIIAGGELKLTTLFSDGKTLDVQKDVRQLSGTALTFRADPENSSILIISGSQTGSAEIEIGGKRAVVNVISAPRMIAQSGVSRDSDGYVLTLPVGGSAGIPMTGVTPAHLFIVDPMSEGSAQVTFNQQNNTLAISAANANEERSFRIISNGTVLFNLRVRTVVPELLTSFNARTCILTGSSLSIDLEYTDGILVEPKVEIYENNRQVTQSTVVWTSIEDEGRRLVIEGRKEGAVRLTVDGKSFEVIVQSADISLALADGVVQEGLGVYTVTAPLKKSMALQLNGRDSSSVYGMKPEKGDASIAQMKVNTDKNRIEIFGLKPGATVYEIMSETDGEERVLLTVKIIVEEPPKHVHVEQKIPAVAATCTATGLTEGVKCAECGEILTAQQTIPRKDHQQEVLAAKAATCTENGLTSGLRCSVCGEILLKQETIPATGHTVVELAGKEATCTEHGLTAGEKCSVCGEILKVQSAIIKKGHRQVTIPGRAATCTATGLTDGVKCSVCNEILTEQKVINKLAHREVEIPAVAATATQTGLTAGVKCADCGEILVPQQVISAKGHKETVIPAVEATCTTTGLTEGVKCADCGEILLPQQVIPAKGHKETVIPAVAATCTATGLTEGAKCADCGEILVRQETTPMAAHTETEIPAVAATCTESGLTAGKKCAVCGMVLKAQEKVDELGHWLRTYTVAPTTEDIGYDHEVCQREGCNYYHSYNYKAKLPKVLGFIVFDASDAPVDYDLVQDVYGVMEITAAGEADGTYPLRKLYFSRELIKELYERDVKTIIFIVDDNELEFSIDLFEKAELPANAAAFLFVVDGEDAYVQIEAGDELIDITARVEDIALNGEKLKVRPASSVDVLPTLAADAQLETEKNGYSISLPIGMEYTLKLKNANRNHDISIVAQQSGSAALTLGADKASLMVAAAAGEDESVYVVNCNGTELFTLTVNTVTGELTNKFKSAYTIFVDGTAEMELKYGHHFPVNPEVVVSNPNIISASLADDGHTLLLTALKEGISDVTVDGKSFLINTCLANVGLEPATGLTQENANTYRLVVRANTSVTLKLTNYDSRLFSLRLKKNGSEIAAIDDKGDTLVIDSVKPGTAVHEVYSRGNADEAQLFFTLIVEVVE